VSGRASLLPQARRTMRAKITVLEDAFTGRFTSHHALLLGAMLSRVDALSVPAHLVDDRPDQRPSPPGAGGTMHHHSPGVVSAGERSERVRA
jgi:transposase